MARAALALLTLLTLAAAAPPRAEPAKTTSCLACHAEQQAPLAKSRHGLASGPGLWGQLPESGPHVGAGLACLLCHAPASDQQPWRTLAPDAGSGLTPTEARSVAISASAAAPNPQHDPHATPLGVSCTACHVAEGRIVAARADPRAPHPVQVEPSLRDPSLCARCHQFGPASAVAGKPLENTYAEWKASSWARAGATCQSCHMPGGRHLFQGIHTPSLVRTAAQVTWTIGTVNTGELSITNSGAGHDLPTYTTPRLRLTVQAEDAQGRPVGTAATELLGRDVANEAGTWRERSDTRIAPGATHRWRYALRLPPGAARLRATVEVLPDFAYVDIYERLLRSDALTAAQRRSLEDAWEQARRSPFTIFDERRNL